jgi:hypothetical protein
MSQTYIAGPAIAILRNTSRTAAHKAIRRGTYGRVLWHGRMAYVPLAALERELGQRLTEDQLTLASGRNPRRVIIVTTEAA